VQLNPSNLEAQSDLFEYYLEAPAFWAGIRQGIRHRPADCAHQPHRGVLGTSRAGRKAQGLLHRRNATTPRRRDCPQEIGRLIDLARLFTKQGRYQDADLSLAKRNRSLRTVPNSCLRKPICTLKVNGTFLLRGNY